MYGYKLNAVCSLFKVFKSFDLSPASVHEIHYLKDFKEQLSDYNILAVKGDLSSQIKLDLFNTENIKSETLMGSNQKNNHVLNSKQEKELKLCSVNYSTNL